MNTEEVRVNKNMNWIEEEDKKYSKLYEEGYPSGSPQSLVDWTRPKVKKSEKTLDLGCGRATLKNKFNYYTGVDVSEYIVSENSLKYPKSKFYHESLSNLGFLNSEHFVNAFCADVMEHIPEENVNDVLKSISELNVDRYFFAISTRPSKILDSVGGNLHLTIKEPIWWHDKLSEYFEVAKEKVMNDLIYFELK